MDDAAGRRGAEFDYKMSRYLICSGDNENEVENWWTCPLIIELIKKYLYVCCCCVVMMQTSTSVSGVILTPTGSSLS